DVLGIVLCDRICACTIRYGPSFQNGQTAKWSKRIIRDAHEKPKLSVTARNLVLPDLNHLPAPRPYYSASALQAALTKSPKIDPHTHLRPGYQTQYRLLGLAHSSSLLAACQ